MSITPRNTYGFLQVSKPAPCAIPPLRPAQFAGALKVRKVPIAAPRTLRATAAAAEAEWEPFVRWRTRVSGHVTAPERPVEDAPGFSGDIPHGPIGCGRLRRNAAPRVRRLYRSVMLRFGFSRLGANIPLDGAAWRRGLMTARRFRPALPFSGWYAVWPVAIHSLTKRLVILTKSGVLAPAVGIEPTTN